MNAFETVFGVYEPIVTIVNETEVLCANWGYILNAIIFIVVLTEILKIAKEVLTK